MTNTNPIDAAAFVEAFIKSEITDLTFENPTSLLGYVLAKHREGFFYFLLNGPRREISREAVVMGMEVFEKGNSGELKVVEEEGICPNEWTHSQFNPATRAGIQNIYALAYICDIIE